MKKIALLALSCLLSSSLTFAQITPAPSPGASISQVVGVNKITIEYSRPSLKGREIFGKLIPFDKVYRTGANAATKIELTGDITVQGQPLKAGKYAIMSIPTQTNWTIIFSKKLDVTEQNYNAADDVLRVTARPQDISPVETLTFDFSDLKDDGATLNFSWEKTKVSLNIGVDNAASIENAVNQKNTDASNTFQQAADYMLQKGMDLTKALSLIDKSLALRENFRNNWIKAQILDKLGKSSDALGFALKAQSLGAGDGSYQFFKDGIEKGINEIKAKIPAAPASVTTPKKKKN
ncbi:hypothetical protein Emtol_3717 [Emticicia oligotrophica DSM 17448]|uniref:DUF2911 domain-containing protein n=1 Tax=Emticicia oligotrophica (strain DSM 17448 / CIP 109782 / MTCC 6937 / GPTSA100-15) TaxID=929562 RepID=A0ABN4AQZ7_EMTOG|nr:MULTISPECIES: DUF2911 domain-containing protein [Emticicia]AFK04843.1 hypothetical protein Emtol_3717 [Emticicia oligotrophica DSM 17448]